MKTMNAESVDPLGVTEQGKRQNLHKVLALPRVKGTLPALLCLVGMFVLLSSCTYSDPEGSPTSTPAPSPVKTNPQRSPVPPPTPSNASSPAEVGCATVGLSINEISGIVGFPLDAAKDVQRGCSYRTSQIPLTTTVEILDPLISTPQTFEEEYAQLAAATPAPGKCVWANPTHSAFTCTGTTGPDTKEFRGASLSMVFAGDHTWQFIIGTDDPSAVPSAEAGAWKLSQEILRRNK